MECMTFVKITLEEPMVGRGKETMMIPQSYQNWEPQEASVPADGERCDVYIS